MRITIFTVCCLTLSAPPLLAQAPVVTTALRDSIMRPVHAVFAGIAARDTGVMRAAFAPGALLGGVPALGKAPGFVTVDAFLRSIAGAPATMRFRERVYDAEIRVDGGLATAWMFYTFEINDKISHCGVDAFQLVRTSGGWKAIAVADTRRSDGCAVAGRRLEVAAP